MTSVTFLYHGGAGVTLGTNDGSITDHGDSTYTVSSTDKLTKNLEIISPTGTVAAIHTSCSHQILGQEFSGILKVTGYIDRNGMICSDVPQVEITCESSCYATVEQMNQDIAVCMEDYGWSVDASLFSMQCIINEDEDYCQPHFDFLMARYPSNNGPIPCEELERMGCCASSYLDYTVLAKDYFVGVYDGFGDWLQANLDHCQIFGVCQEITSLVRVYEPIFMKAENAQLQLGGLNPASALSFSAALLASLFGLVMFW